MANKRVKGEGSVSRRKDGRYEGRLSLGVVGEKRSRKTVYGATKTQVSQKLRELRAKNSLLQTDLRVAEYLDLWLQDGVSRWEPQTYRSYQSWLKHVRPYLGNRKVADLTPSDIKVWLRLAESANVGATSRKRALSTLRSALKALVDEGELLRNACDVIKGPKLKRRDFHVPEPWEVQKLLDAADPYWVRVLLLVAFTCTMRQGEILALHWSQVDFTKGSMFVNKTLATGLTGMLERKTTKTKSSRRTLFLPSITLEALRKLKQHQGKAGYAGPWIFPDADGGPLRKSNFLRRQYKPALARAELPHFRFHALRHAGNSLLIAQGEDALSIARRMGHSDTRLTFDTYGHLFEGSGKRSAQNMEHALDAFGIRLEQQKNAESETK